MASALSNVSEQLVLAVKVIDEFNKRMAELQREVDTLRRENARLLEQERDMMRASTVVRALNENSRLREEADLLKRSLALRASSNSLTSLAPPIPETTAHQDAPTEEEEEEASEEEASEEEASEEEESSFTEITYKKKHYCMDANGNVFDRAVCESYDYDEAMVAKHAPVAGSYAYDANGKLRITLAA